MIDPISAIIVVTLWTIIVYNRGKKVGFRDAGYQAGW